MYDKYQTTGAPINPKVAPTILSQASRLNDLSSHLAHRLQGIVDRLEGSPGAPSNGSGDRPSAPIGAELNIATNNLEQVEKLIQVLDGKLF